MADDVTLKTPAGISIQAFESVTPDPPGWKTTSPAVILLHDMWGLDDYAQWQAERLCDVLRANVLAPDLVKGAKAEQPEEGAALEAAVDREHAAAVVEACAERLRKLERSIPEQIHLGKPAVPYSAFNGRIALIGVGLGARVALAAAERIPEVTAVVTFYGLGDGLKRGGVAVQAHFASEDASIGADARARFTSSVAGAEVVVHEGAARGFIDDVRWANHRADLAKAAWVRVIPFLREHLDVAPDGRPRQTLREGAPPYSGLGWPHNVKDWPPKSDTR